MRTPALVLSLALIGGLAVLAVLSATDASAARGGSTAVSDLTGYGAAGARVAAATALERGDAARAASIARTTVLRAPIERGGTSLLGLARLTEGDAAGGIAAMRAALMLGWRDPLTQAWALQASIDDGDTANAVLRLDALARLNGGNDTALAAAIDRLASDPVFRAALAKRMAENPNWVRPYLRAVDGLSVSQSQVRNQLTVALAETGALTDHFSRQAAVRRAQLAEGAEVGATLYEKLYATKPAGLQDSEFRRPDSALPFEWDYGPGSYPSADGLQMSWSPTEQTVASQFFRKAAGRHRFKMRLEPVNSADAIKIVMRCVSQPQVGTQLLKSDWTRAGEYLVSRQIDVPDCPLHQLAIVTLAANENRPEAVMTTLRLEPTGAR